MCISLTNATVCRHDIQMDTVRTQRAVIIEIRLYPAEGPMPRASEAPFALVDIVRCSKSWITVDAGRCSQCSPTNGSPGRRRVPRGRRCRTSSRGIAPRKPNRRTPYARFVGGQGFRTYSPAAPCTQRYGTGKAKRLLRYGLSRKRSGRSGLTEDCRFMVATGREKGSG